MDGGTIIGLIIAGLVGIGIIIGVLCCVCCACCCCRKETQPGFIVQPPTIVQIGGGAPHPQMQGQVNMAPTAFENPNCWLQPTAPPMNPHIAVNSEQSWQYQEVAPAYQRLPTDSPTMYQK